MVKLRDLLDCEAEAMDDNEGRTVLKTVPIKAEWKALHDECIKMAEEIKMVKRKLDAKRKFMWSTIDIDMDEYSDKRYNETSHEIEILAPAEINLDRNVGDGRPIKSPLQRI